MDLRQYFKKIKDTEGVYQGALSVDGQSRDTRRRKARRSG
jgi:hypothetical protein